MKKYLIIATTILLAACSSLSSTSIIKFDPQAVTNLSQIDKDISFTLTSQDDRSVQYIALLKKEDSNQTIPINATEDVRSTYEAAIYQQFYSQGFYATRKSDNIININVIDTLATVNQSTVNYQIDAKITVEITAETPNGKFVKKFYTSGSKSEPLIASTSDVENILNSLASSVLENIATDAELRNYITENF